MKYEIYIKSGRKARITLNVKYNGKTYTESAQIQDIVKDDNFGEKFDKRLEKALGPKAYKKFIKKLEKDFENC